MRPYSILDASKLLFNNTVNCEIPKFKNYIKISSQKITMRKGLNHLTSCNSLYFTRKDKYFISPKYFLFYFDKQSVKDIGLKKNNAEGFNIISYLKTSRTP